MDRNRIGHLPPRRLPLIELSARCQKRDHRRLGNWMARRIARPVALRITWVIQPWPVSAHAITLAAWSLGLVAAAALAQAHARSWLLGVAALQVWYLLDHVDGQIARLRNRSSLDGVQLDYLMHHCLSLLVPVGAGWGIGQSLGDSRWAGAGLAWGAASLLAALVDDTRAKAFVQRLKVLDGTLEVYGGAGGRPAPPAEPPSDFCRRISWLAQKACEVHVTMNMLSLLALARWLTADRWLDVAAIYVGCMALVAPCVTAWKIARSITQQEAERQFAAWFRPKTGQSLQHERGRWQVVACDELHES